jgi:TPR repeat protein
VPTACGKGEDSSGLKACLACKLVEYCNPDCQLAHRPQHEKECEKRAAELVEDKLFNDPPPKDDCPICMLPLPINIVVKLLLNHAVGNTSAMAAFMPHEKCFLAVVMPNQLLCQYCGESEIKHINQEKINQINKLNDLADIYFNGKHGIEIDMEKAKYYYSLAAIHGDASARYNIGMIEQLVTKNFKQACKHFLIAGRAGCNKSM